MGLLAHQGAGLQRKTRKRFRWTAIALVAAVWTIAVAAAESADRAAVPLYTPPLTTPDEARGTGVAPEVTVRVVIDASGRVTEVRTSKIEPSTDLDDLFECTTRETLLSWRYVPATKQGKPVEVNLEWTVQFAEIAQRERKEQRLPTYRGMAGQPEREAEEFRRRLLSLPPDVRRKMLGQLAETARSHLARGNISKYASLRFLVYTDAPEKQVAQVVAQNLEATFGVLHELLEPWVAPQPEPYRIVVFVFHSRAQFDRLKGNIRGIEWSSGFYNPLGLIAFNMEMPSSAALMSTMLHEATHAYIDRYVSRPGVVLPRWLNEGLADYIGSSTIKKKQLIPGKTRRSAIIQSPWGAMMGQSRSQLGVDEVKRAIKGKQPLSLAQIISADRQTFYGEERDLYYSMSWLLVHFLRHGEEDWAEQRFPKLMLYVAEGYPPLDALSQVYGDPGRLEERFFRYVLKF